MKSLISCMVLISLIFIQCLGNSPANAQNSSTPGITISIIKSAVNFKNNILRYDIGLDGRNLRFIDKETGIDYLDHSSDSYFAYIVKNGLKYNASQISVQNDSMTVKFGNSNVIANIRFKTQNRYITMEVVSVSDNTIDELSFVNIPLTLNATLDELFAGSTLSLNLKTNVIEQPGLQSNLSASCYSRFGMIGAKAAIIGCKTSVLRSVIKDVVLASAELPHSIKGGPWAMEDGTGRRSFVMNVLGIRSGEVNSWINMCKSMGVTGIDFHTGNGWLRFGDYQPYPAYPDAINELKYVISKLHEAGIIATFHSYSFIIAADSPYVTPTPDARLAKDKTFTLSEAINSDAVIMKVLESTAGISPHSTYGGAFDATIQIDNELITFTGVSSTEPYSFTGCVRGARGTTKSAHSAGAKAYLLKMVFGGFLPDADSTLFTEIAQRHAQIYNECNFDGFYFDAIDGAFIYAGWDDAWHYASKFVYEVEKNINHPGIFDYSAFWHHFWYLRSRYGSWDTSKRGHKALIDEHALSNKIDEKLFLPTTLGWTDIINYGNSIYPERTFSDDIEYLGTKCMGNDSGYFMGLAFTPSRYASDANLQRLSGILSTWEEYRQSKTATESIKSKLRVPRDEYTISKTGTNQWQVKPIVYDKHKIEAIDSGSNLWTVNNKFSAQPALLRIEPLASSAEYNSPTSVTVCDFANPKDFFVMRGGSSQVVASFYNVTTPIKTGTASGYFTAISQHEDRTIAFVKATKSLPTTLDLSNAGFGVWIHGDNNGEIMNIQFQSYSYEGAGLDDYMIPINFTGWKYFEFVEPDSTPILHVWNPGIYRQRAEFINIFLSNLPKGINVNCYISPIKALPIKVVKIKNPAITLNGLKVTFPVEISAGSYIEYRSMSDCKVYGPDGAVVQSITPVGVTPTLKAGQNQIGFTQETVNERIRAKVTVISQGTPIQ